MIEIYIVGVSHITAINLSDDYYDFDSWDEAIAFIKTIIERGESICSFYKQEINPEWFQDTINHSVPRDKITEELNNAQNMENL